MRYNQKVLQHFSDPRNVGEIPDADGVGSIGDPSCGDFLRVWIKVRNFRIAEIKFQCKGCPAAIATASIMTELAIGKHIDEAADITDEVVADALDGLPPEKRHCSNFAASGLYEAIMDYVLGSRKTNHNPGQRTSRAI